MMGATKLRLVILKPSKYGVDRHVERFRWGFMPNSTIAHLSAMTPAQFEGCAIETIAIDEYVQTDLEYLRLLAKASSPTLLALVGVQSHQFHRALDLAAYALQRGVEHCIIGGPHPMTCDTSMFHGRRLSFCLSEAETTWSEILHDAVHGELKPLYGATHRWQNVLEAPVLKPPSAEYLRRYVVPMLGIYPARGCPFSCNFCSVIKIAGRQIRAQSIETVIATLRGAKAAGVKLIMFTSDNFNKYPDAPALLAAMIEEELDIPFFVQCDAQVGKDEGFLDALSRAGCFEMFVGVESFNRTTLMDASKAQNHPERYEEIVRLSRKYGIATHFSNIIGFPRDTTAGVAEHIETLRGLNPDSASFYILTPIPGTEQYDDFLQQGLITELNLDRFDGTCATWRHNNFSSRELNDLLFSCYKRFYTFAHCAEITIRNIRHKRPAASRVLQSIGGPLFSRFAAHRGMHPMSGGVRRVVLDSSGDYADLRRQRFGFQLAPLPRSLQLSPADTLVNRKATLV
jgi:hypothetical protein